MSASTDKATRRDLRRALGPDALETLNRQGAHLTGVGAVANYAHERLGAHDIQLDRLHRDLTDVRRRLGGLTESSSLWTRLRWVFRG